MKMVLIISSTYFGVKLRVQYNVTFKNIDVALGCITLLFHWKNIGLLLEKLFKTAVTLLKTLTEKVSSVTHYLYLVRECFRLKRTFGY